MDDDKIEKLREHLRNNRPKSKINLGNSSDNKENFTENLKKDSDLNKRDYDKDPLIIKNLKYKLNYLSSVLCLILTSFFTIIAIIFDLVPIQKIIFNDFIAFIVLYPAFTDGKNSVDGYFKFENSTITSFGFFEKKIETKEISKIIKTFDTSESMNTISANKYIVFIGLFLIFLVIKTAFQIFHINIFNFILFVFILLIIGMIPHFIFYRSFSEPFIIYNMIAIFDKNDTIINVLIPGKNEYYELKKYFLYRKNINLDYCEKQLKLIKFT
ncbi:hypothetical protein [Campylobacter ureolyticus]|uniref:hypothetical protein n=1 Tax=Campylobacter ureolyticus TaxID=827 RepID=UPI0029085DD6|nr:hypothetical protein [Campylobacter ureolyticus]MDU7070428.1 hypothetical protein [Campylobacter ureolyticus]